MKAITYSQFQGPLSLETLPDPDPIDGAVVVEVKATGLCRSDWHGWMGHDPDIALPHVPGHELAGVIRAVGKGVEKWKEGDRITVPFVGGCGHCQPCRSGNHQVCDHQFQPGFTHWGSFAQYVALHHADINLVSLPESMDFVTAASLGCRFVTAFRGLASQAKLSPGQWVAVHGCGGVGLSAIMIASALGAKVIAVDIDVDKLNFAISLGASAVVDASGSAHVVEAVKELSRGGVHVSVDALGSKTTCFNSISNLRKRGKHIQGGVMVGDDYLPPVPMHQIVAEELEVLGSHG
ncbi:MAG: zinc-dependent alcohol dehydrogenase family protein, partial [Cyclobacteriaceae bacterium]